MTHPSDSGALDDALLAELLNEDGFELPDGPQTIQPRRQGERVLATPAQQRMWAVERIDGVTGEFNLGLDVRFDGPIDDHALERALLALLQRHEGLRVRFAALDDGTVEQRIVPIDSLPLPRHAMAADRWAAAMREAVAQPFDLGAELLLRAQLLHDATSRQSALLLTFHHNIVDLWAAHLALGELAMLYARELGEAVVLPAPVQFGDYAVWLREPRQVAAREQRHPYWLSRLAQLPLVLELPLSAPREQAHARLCERIPVALPAPLAAAIKHFADARQATPFVVVLAAFQAVLMRFSGMDDIAVGVPVANRQHQQAQAVVGFLAETMVARTRFQGDPGFAALVEQVRDDTLADLEHQGVPHDELVRLLNPPRRKGIMPLFQAMLVFQTMPPLHAQAAGVRMQGVPVPLPAARADLLLELDAGTQGLTGALEYRRQLIDPDVAAAIATAIVVLLEAAIARPQTPLSQLPLQRRSAGQAMLALHNPPMPAASERTLSTWFVERAARTPDAVALVDGDRALSYAELERRSASLAAHLAGLGVGAETPVAICLPRSQELAVAILATLRAGGAFVPMAPDFPGERLAFMLDDSAAAVLIASGRPQWLAGDARVRLVDPADALPTAAAPADPTTPDSLLYILYTSGSTGRPKAVLGLHRGAVNRLEWMMRAYPFEAGERCGQKTAPTFVDFIWEFFGPLLAGVPSAILPEALVRDPVSLAAALQQYGITRLVLVPSLMKAMFDHVPDIGQRLHALRHCTSSGEVLPGDLARRFREQLPHCRLLNLYGSSEVSADSTFHEVGDAPGAQVSIGRPIPGNLLVVLDTVGNVLPVGVPGEIVIGGTGLARGYIDRDGSVAARFVELPDGIAGGRGFRSGDLGRWRGDGAIDYLGRLDRQVKIRGVRIDPLEIRAVLMDVAGVTDVAVAAREIDGESILVAYVASDAQAHAHLEAALRRRAQGALPGAWQPTRYAFLPALPLNANGKVDFLALPAPREAGAAPLPEQPQAVLTLEESMLADLWQQVTGQRPRHPQDQFFQCGGHSLSAVRLAASIERSFGVQLPVTAIFEGPSLHAMAQALGKATGADRLPEVIAGGAHLRARASANQERLWLLEQTEDQRGAYNQSVAYRLRGRLDVARLVTALERVVRRHEALRTRLVASQGELWQEVEPAAGLAFEHIERGTAAERDAILREFVARPFNLTLDLPLRTMLLRQGPDEHLLVLMLHHTAIDGSSGRVIVDELGQAYLGPLDALPPAVQQIDFSEWQRACQEQGLFAPQDAYWRDRLAGAPAVLGLALSHMPEQRDYRLESLPLALGRARTAGVRQAADEARVSVFALLLGLWGLTLARFGGDLEAMVGIPVAARSREGLEHTVGFLTNTLPMRIDCRADDLAGLARTVQHGIAAGLQHQDIPLNRIIDAAAVERIPGRSPLLQAMFILADVQQWTLRLEGVEALAQTLAAPRARTDLSLVLQQHGQDIDGVLEFAADVISPALAARLVDAFVHLLDTCLASPAAAPLSHALVDGPAGAQLAQFSSAPTVLAPAAGPLRLHGLLRVSARRHGDAPALVTPEGTVSYAQLDRLSEQVARDLRQAGIGRGARVALLGERGPGLIAGLAGISKADAIFVPIDPTYPAARIAQILEDAAVDLVLGEHPGEWQPGACRFMPLPVADARSLAALPELSALPADEDDGDFDAIACIIFTSGSTGRPKGVLLAHHALCRLALSATAQFAIGRDSRLLQLAAFGFDVAVSDIAFAMAAGASLCLAPREQLLPGSPLVRTLAAMAVTHLQIPASLLAAMPAAPLPALRTLIVGGEVCPAAVAAQWQAGRDLFIAYGPTETTVTVTAGRYLGPHAPLQIGRPLGDARIHVLDAQGRPVPVGVVGELHVGGPVVSQGYFRQPALTAERFIPDPFADGAQGHARAILYRSGDRARWREDGTLDFLGRGDREFKLRGFRIAPAEIEAALAGQTGVAQALVMLRADGAGQSRMVAYVAGVALDTGALRAELRRRLPAYMVPDAVIPLAAMPLTGNGKIDVHALPMPVMTGQTGQAAEGGPGAVGRAGDTAANDALGRVAALWRQVLKLDDIDPDANFFDVGGHSLLLVQLHDVLAGEFGTPVAISDLFRFPTIRSLASFLARSGPTEAAPASAPAPAHGEIAVIGMACRYPGAPNLEAFWQLLLEGMEGISRLDPAGLPAAGREASAPQAANFVAADGVIEAADCFDAELFGLGPRDALTLDPQHRVALECAWHTLEHAGYAPMGIDDPVGVFVGVGANTYLHGQLLAANSLRDGADIYHAMSANDKDFAATRIAYQLDLHGPALAVQTACSSSLTALDMACRALRTGAARMALAGGVAIRFPQGVGYFHEPGMILSPDGHCKPFSDQARGTVPSGGVGMVLLKPLASALADGDNVLAVVRGSAINNDGARKVGYAAPGVDGQAKVIAAALQEAGVAPDDIDYVEAHGTGTQLGDPVEVAALARVFGGRSRMLALGSVKSNIGHADAAAGVAGLIKTVLALQHGVLPASLHFSAPNPHIDFAGAGIEVVSEARPWPDCAGRPRRAGVSAFGIGGTNVHVVLEQAPPRPSTSGEPPLPEILPLSARTPASLRAGMLALVVALEKGAQDGSLPLRDVAFTLQHGRAMLGCRHAVVARTTAQAIDALREAAQAMADGDAPMAAPAAAAGARIALLFPGQGSQYPRMAQALYEGDDQYRACFDRCAQSLLPHLGQDLRVVLYGLEADNPAGGEALRQTALAQPALFAVMYALARSLEARGVVPDAMLGHSLGEYVAACLAGVFTLDEALALVAARGRLMQALPGGAMLAVQADEAPVRALLTDDALDGPALSLAAANGPGQSVWAGPAHAVDALQARLAAAGIPALRLQTSHAFHSAAMDTVLPAFVAAFEPIVLKAPQRRFISNVTGDWISDAQATDPSYWARHLRQTVRFGDGLETLRRDGLDVLLEAGPGNTLQKLASAGSWSSRQLLTSGLSRHAPADGATGGEALAGVVAQCWARGVTIRWPVPPRQADEAGQRPPSRAALPGYAFERRRYWPEASAAALPTLSPLQSPSSGRADIADWFYLPGWQRAPRQVVATAGAAVQTWLLLGADTEAGHALADALRRAGQHVVEVAAGSSCEQSGPRHWLIDPADGLHYRSLLDEVAATRIVHLWGSAPQDLETTLTRGFVSVVLLAQALGARVPVRGLRLDVVTRGAADVTGDEPLVPALGALQGLARILPVEYPGLACRLVDIDAGVNGAALSNVLMQDTEEQVALRGRHRWIPQWQPIRLDTAPPDADRLRTQGCYLVTGAFGGMGASIANDLAARCQARLVLLGRHVDQKLVARLEHAGAEVLAIACDIADAAAMAQAITAVRARFGAIHGVFHCAGVADLDGVIQNRDLASMYRVMAAKVQGTVLLDRLLAADTLDFMVLFSSLGNVLPQAKFGQAAYAAANEFLDVFALERYARTGSFTVAINWDDWSEAGMTVAARRRRGKAAQGDEADEGMRSADGIEVLRRTLAAPHARVAVSIRDLPQLMRHADELLEHLAMPLAPAETTAVVDESAVTAMSDTEARLAASWSRILGVEGITPQSDFFALGGHSLIGMRLLGFVRDTFGVDLGIAALFEHSTLAALASHIDGHRPGDEGMEEFTI